MRPVVIATGYAPCAGERIQHFLGTPYLGRAGFTRDIAIDKQVCSATILSGLNDRIQAHLRVGCGFRVGYRRRWKAIEPQAILSLTHVHIVRHDHGLQYLAGQSRQGCELFLLFLEVVVSRVGFDAMGGGAEAILGLRF